MSAPEIPNLLTSLRGGGGRGRGRGGPPRSGGSGPRFRGASASASARTRGRRGGGGANISERGGHHHINHFSPHPDSSSSSSSSLARRGPQNDLDVQATDSDAAVSRLSAVSLGYLEDGFAGFFVSGGGAGGGGRGVGVRRMPVINRGTYVRTRGIDGLVDSFLASLGGDREGEGEGKGGIGGMKEGEDKENKRNEGGGGIKRQIISLGAGTDTRFFRLRRQGKTSELGYHEFDFPDVARLKYGIVERREELGRGEGGEVLFRDEEGSRSENGNGEGEMTTEEPEWGFTRDVNGEKEVAYCFHPLDLRQLADTNSNDPTTDTTKKNNKKKITDFKGIRDDLPTLLISECCLCYLPVPTATSIITFFTSRLSSLGLILYEPIGGHTPFGQTMAANLAVRNLTMPTVRAYRDLDDQKRRLAALGFDGGCEAVDVETVWERWVDDEEKRRVDALEGLDEVEEWQVIARCYAVVWGWMGGGWEGWERRAR